MPINNFVFQDKEYCMIIYSKKDPIPNYIKNYENKKIIFKNPIGSSYKKTEHPTEKPLNIFGDLIKKHSKENDLILDPFMGSGTTTYACEQLKRKWLGCEINNNYFAIIEKKLNKIELKLNF
ncbi:site-specific DNA-methyltransferase [Spiroplasma endosymbiont of Polydrusus cervinus]|uniref:site-specific DNA-methyltransferase n=1 Tax=Spiroplasma endosymbiont of Polydrusus cervinus TaxID=3066287 RepID=UPI0030CF4080